MHNFVIEKLNTIDDEYVLQKYLVPNNNFVKKGQSFVEIETSKTAVVLDAPCDGYIIRKVDENSKIKVITITKTILIQYRTIPSLPISPSIKFRKNRRRHFRSHNETK